MPQSSAPPVPLVEELPSGTTAANAFIALAALPHVVYFDSALSDTRLGRYSFVAADPFAWIEVPSGRHNALSQIADRMANYQSASMPDLPPFQGGAAGMLSYDLARIFERVPEPRFDEFRIPQLAVGLYDTVVAFDHDRGRAWVISQGWPRDLPHERQARAADRLRQFLAMLKKSLTRRAGISACRSIPIVAPQYPTRFGSYLTSTFSEQGYQDAVARTIDYILAGDVFQVNLSQRLLHPAATSTIDLYLRLRERNPAPFGGYLRGNTFEVCSASPERFLRCHGGAVETRPIKGTRRRSSSPEADLYAADELSTCQKDRAENVMIVDLLRNDLARNCEPDSISVTGLCEIERYAYVQHLVSTVEGRLLAGRTCFDLLAGAFPGGSITGAPKPRAMEIIAELEPTARGPYCGSLFYCGFDGTMDSNILIRTVTSSGGWWQLPVGGGIVAKSSPEAELEETWAKAAGLVQALAP